MTTPPMADVLPVYVASRASIEARPQMWRALRDRGWQISSTWIDKLGEDTSDNPDALTELWACIESEIAQSAGVLLYGEPEDFPLRGALMECGFALGMGKHVAIVAPGVEIDENMRPLGSWVRHPRVQMFSDLESARDWLLDPQPVLDASPGSTGPRPGGR